MESVTAEAGAVLLRQPITCAYFGGSDLLDSTENVGTTPTHLEGNPHFGESTAVAIVVRNSVRTAFYGCSYRLASATTEHVSESETLFAVLRQLVFHTAPIVSRLKLFRSQEPDLDDALSLQDASRLLNEHAVIKPPANVVAFRFPRP